MLSNTVSYSILGYIFTIVTNSSKLLTNQISHIAQFSYSKPTKAITSSTSIEIEYIEDANLFSELKEKILNAKGNQTILTFEKEYHIKATIGTDICFMQMPDKYIVVKRSERSFVVIGDGIKDTTKYVFRLIREILVRLQENKNKIFMHATSLITNNYGIAILGNAGSGKTTYFSKLLSVGHSSIISNDRTFFYFDQKPMMDYFPIPIVYKVGAVSNNTNLRQHIIESGKYSLPEAFIQGKSSYPIPLTDVPDFFEDTNSCQTSNLDLIIFSKIDFDNPYCFEAKFLPNNEAIQLMTETCFTPVDRESLRSVWIYPRLKSDAELEVDANNLIKEIVRTVPIVYVRFGKDIDSYELYNKTMQLLE